MKKILAIRMIALLVTVGFAVYVSAVELTEEKGDIKNISINAQPVDTLYFEEVKSLNEYDEYKLNHIPDTIKEYKLVTVNPMAFRRDVDSGKIVKLKLADEEFELELKPVPPPDEGAKLCIKNETGGHTVVDLPPTYSYSGKVVGLPKSKAHFTVGNDVILGDVDIIGIDYIIDQTGWVKENGHKKVLHIVYSTKAMVRREGPLNYDLLIMAQTIPKPQNSRAY